MYILKINVKFEIFFMFHLFLIPFYNEKVFFCCKYMCLLYPGKKFEYTAIRPSNNFSSVYSVISIAHNILSDLLTKKQ